MSDDDSGLPLHDEAKARSKWRGGETILKREDGGDSGPASEIDDGGSGGNPDAGAGGRLEEDLARRPPD